MKKALTIIEVLISIFLISLVIGSLLQIKTNNLYIIEKSELSSIYKNLISLFALDYKKVDNRNTQYDIKNSMSLDDDKLEKKIDILHINVKDSFKNENSENDLLFTFDVLETEYNASDKAKTKYYIIRNIQ